MDYSQFISYLHGSTWQQKSADMKSNKKVSGDICCYVKPCQYGINSLNSL